MGIGRRRFLQFMAATLGAAALEPGVARAAVALRDRDYINRVLGLGFRIPPGWHLQQGQDFGFLRRETTLVGMDDALRAAFDADPHIDPVAVLSAEPVDEFVRTGRYGPSIALHFDPAHTIDVSAGADAMVVQYLRMLGELLPGFEILGPTARGTVSQCPIWTQRSRFDFISPRLDAPVVNETTTVMIQTVQGFYTVHLHEAPAIGARARTEHRGFLDSLVIM